ncbi:MAG: DUF4369 domain-containing protein [Prevotella sp.]|nr:DUF4369 domain-containing protein [Prevotella sp.]MCD8289146.1 DUF4369 domain-containing protein [Prevotella sp.]MCD8306510.1 DUF4369 domain-containing protein [Prevotella sp.]
MKQGLSIITVLAGLAAVVSCASSYNIHGSSNISTLDGRMLYLKVLDGDEFRDVDSCDVVHGQFSFHGTYDSVYMANIFMENEQLMPIVVEGGNIKVQVDNADVVVDGSPMNDKLFGFLRQYNQIIGEQADLVHRHDQAIMDGSNMNTVLRELQMEDMRLSMKEDSLVTGFVKENYDNCLGPGVFFLTTIGYDYPLLTPWVEDIMSRATDYFKSNPYVRTYYQKALENQQIMNGLLEAPSSPYATQPQP